MWPSLPCAHSVSAAQTSTDNEGDSASKMVNSGHASPQVSGVRSPLQRANPHGQKEMQIQILCVTFLKSTKRMNQLMLSEGEPADAHQGPCNSSSASIAHCPL